MERLFFKILAIMLSIAPVSACALKISPLSLQELKASSSSFFEVQISSSQLSNKVDPFNANIKLIIHSASVINEFSAQRSSATSIQFSHIEGLQVGKKYIVFLLLIGDENRVLNRQYGAFEVSIVTLDKKLVEAVRIPSSYVKLPPNLNITPGVSRKDENSDYVWVALSAFHQVLSSAK